MKTSRIVLIVLLAITLAMPACGHRLESKSVEIYYIDSDTLDIASKRIKIKGDLSEEIISALIDEGVLQKECVVKRVETDLESKKIKIDINTAFGNYIRGMGTAGEEEILQCTARTYLDAYDCEQILITEEGKVLETGHRVVEEYLSYE